MLLCDEPTGALDSQTGKLVLEVIAQSTASWAPPTAVITHNAAIAGMADRVIRSPTAAIEEHDENTSKVSAAQLAW